MPDQFFVSDLDQWIALGVSILIGTLIGVQRETAKTQSNIGLRDFVLTSVLGWLAARINEPWFLGATLVAIVIVLIVRRLHDVNRGITTELALAVTYGLAVAVSGSEGKSLLPVAIALSIVVTIILGAKENVKGFISASVTHKEVNATVRFLALIFIILPLLPEGRFGPYEFFDPRALWLAVILVSGISFISYFLRKFLGNRVGIWITGMVGGSVSTTITTSSFASDVKQDPSRLRESWAAATASNAVQFIRILVLVSFVASGVAQSLLIPSLTAFSVGILFALGISRGAKTSTLTEVKIENPMRILPALAFAAFMACVSLVSAFGLHVYGTQALFITSAFGSLLDVDAVVLSATNMSLNIGIPLQSVHLVIIIAVAGNIITKAGIAYANGTPAFFVRMVLSFAVMMSAFAFAFMFV